MALFNRKKPERQEWKVPALLQLLRGVLGTALSLAKIAVGGVVLAAVAVIAVVAFKKKLMSKSFRLLVEELAITTVPPFLQRAAIFLTTAALSGKYGKAWVQ